MTAWSGKRWMDGAVVYTGFVAILPPNSPSPTGTNDFEGAIVTASSNHPGGVNAAMGDGSVKFFSDSIDYQGGKAKADNHWQKRLYIGQVSAWRLGSIG